MLLGFVTRKFCAGIHLGLSSYFLQEKNSDKIQKQSKSDSKVS
jgi:hypothetical protein